MIWRWLVESLKSKSVRELVDLARKWGVTGYSRLKKAELVKLLSRKLIEPPRKKLSGKTKSTGGQKTRKKVKQARQVASRARVKTSATKSRGNSKPAGTKRAKDAGAGKAKTAPAKPALPASYGDGAMVLMARDPQWLYVYWDPTKEQVERLERADTLLLRVMEKAKTSRAREIGRVPVPAHARSWYLQVDMPGSQYRAELGISLRGGRFQVVMASNEASTPHVSASGDDVAFGRFTPGKPPEPALAPPRSARVHSERLYALSAGDVDEGMDSARAYRARRGISSSDLQPRKLGRPERT